MKFTLNDPILKQRRQELRRKHTIAEKAFWDKVRNRQYCGKRFCRQYSVGPYILDFYCPSLKLAVELDGGQHTHDDNQEYDAARSLYLKAKGIDVIRFWNNEVLQNIDDVLNRIEERITPPTPSYPKRGFKEGISE